MKKFIKVLYSILMINLVICFSSLAQTNLSANNYDWISQILSHSSFSSNPFFIQPHPFWFNVYGRPKNYSEFSYVSLNMSVVTYSLYAYYVNMPSQPSARLYYVYDDPFFTYYPFVPSLQIEKVVVPDVIGMDKEDAESLLTSASLTIGAIAYEFSAAIPAGKVISQNPVSGLLVVEGYPVELLISRESNF